MSLDDSATGNVFLDSLPENTRRHIQKRAATVALSVRDAVYHKGGSVDYAYFPIEGIISNVSTMKDGDSIEVGIVGREGMTGFPLLLTGATSASNLYAQISGTSLRISGAAMVEIIGDGLASRRPFDMYAEAILDSVSQYAACNRLHTIQQRFARWLVMAHDRVRGDDIPLTQEFLSLMLGVRRAGVTLAASTLQQAGLIKYTRGRIVVRDRERLQACACECYDTVEDRCKELVGFSIRKHRVALAKERTVRVEAGRSRPTSR
ncbi:MAG TPA: Crp/Fnr family transcriptional regulator [Candidatus Baltobacteraceae bacterium]|jgi:CRP-like cAMP-binding protein